MSAIERFASATEAFQQWALDGTAVGECAAREALAHLAELFGAALALPEVGPDTADAPRVSADEWQRVYQSVSQRLPVLVYRVVLDPLVLEPEATGVGDLADDVADIYRDVVTGLCAYHMGDGAEAVWQWRFHFWAHWGRHAANAIGAFRVWLEENRTAV